MALPAGRRGVRADQVNPDGSLKIDIPPTPGGNDPVEILKFNGTNANANIVTIGELFSLFGANALIYLYAVPDGATGSFGSPAIVALGQTDSAYAHVMGIGNISRKFVNNSISGSNSYVQASFDSGSYTLYGVKIA